MSSDSEGLSAEDWAIKKATARKVLTENLMYCITIQSEVMEQLSGDKAWDAFYAVVNLVKNNDLIMQIFSEDELKSHLDPEQLEAMAKLLLKTRENDY